MCIIRVFRNGLPVYVDRALNFAGSEVFIGLVCLGPGNVRFYTLLFLLFEKLQFLAGLLFLAKCRSGFIPWKRGVSL